MAELSYLTQTYRLRAGSPMPTMNPGDFVLHTFMAEMSDTVMYTCIENLPGSEEFRGQGGDLVSASFSRLNVKDGNIFQGKKVYNPTFVDEDEIG